MSMWRYIRLNNKKTITSVAKENNLTRQTVYKFEKGKITNMKLMSYYLKLNGRDIDIKLAKILDNDLEEYYADLKRSDK